jgi:hypothetical protein
MEPMESQRRDLSDEGSTIKICGRLWKIGDKICVALRKIATKKEMHEKFGGLCPSTIIEGVISGTGSKKKVCVKWTSVSGQPICEYGYGH